MAYGFFSWGRRPSAAARRTTAAQKLRNATRGGAPLSPVAVTGRTIAHTFWGKAWCDNLERYRDFAYRLERGRSYLRSGSVIDLQIEAGAVRAKVAGSLLYDVAIDIDAVAPDAWLAIRRDCAGGVGSRLDLLAGKLSAAVMARLCADRIGLFPAPSAIRFSCSCPDYATMCKHVAAAMYGVGARLDHAPELLFALRRASVDDLVTSALSELPPSRPGSPRVLPTGAAGGRGLAALFGIELADSAVRPDARPAPAARPARATRTAPKAPRAPAPRVAVSPGPKAARAPAPKAAPASRSALAPAPKAAPAPRPRAAAASAIRAAAVPAKPKALRAPARARRR